MEFLLRVSNIARRAAHSAKNFSISKEFLRSMLPAFLRLLAGAKHSLF